MSSFFYWRNALIIQQVVMPLLCFPITHWCVQLGLVSPSDKLLHMILYLESAVPSSQVMKLIYCNS